MAQQNAFGNIKNTRGVGRLPLESHLIADFRSQGRSTFFRHPRGEQTRSQAARLQHHHTTGSEPSSVQQQLRHLSGFTGSGRRCEHQARSRGHHLYQVVGNVVNRQIPGGPWGIRGCSHNASRFGSCRGDGGARADRYSRGQSSRRRDKPYRRQLGS